MERRSVKRTQVDIGASVLPAGQFKLRPCRVIDLTNNGARIKVGALATQLQLPFDFSFDNYRTIRHARLVWCDGDNAGIEFLSESQRR